MLPERQGLLVDAICVGADQPGVPMPEPGQQTLEGRVISEVATLMAENKVRRLPVLNSAKRLVGVVSIGDLAATTGDDDVIGQTVQDISGASANN
jgi:predicted transcriptional regulator